MERKNGIELSESIVNVSFNLSQNEHLYQNAIHYYPHALSNLHTSILQSRYVPHKHIQSIFNKYLLSTYYGPLEWHARCCWAKEKWLWWVVREGKCQDWLPCICSETLGRWRCCLLGWESLQKGWFGGKLKVPFWMYMFEMLLRHKSELSSG